MSSKPDVVWIVLMVIFYVIVFFICAAISFAAIEAYHQHLHNVDNYRALDLSRKE